MAVRIVVSPDLTKREEYLAQFLENLGIKNPHPDLIYINDDSKLGVDEAKTIRQHLSLKPFSFDKRIVLLSSSHKLTLEAQNSLLKTFEEPPMESEIILGVEKLDSLLETVISRCEIVYLESKNSELRVKNDEINIEKFINESVQDRFKQIEKIENKDEFLEELIKYFRKKMHQGERGSVQITETLLEMQQWIQSNVNSRAILEYAALIIPTKNNSQL